MTTIYSSEINHRMLHPKYGFLKIPFQGVADEPVVNFREEDYVLHVRYRGIIDSNTGLIAEVNCFYHCPAADALKAHGVFSDALKSNTSSAVWLLFNYEVVEESSDFYTNWTFEPKPKCGIELLKQLDAELVERFNTMIGKMKAGEVEYIHAEEVLKEFLFEKFLSKDNPDIISDAGIQDQFIMTAGYRRVSEYRDKINSLYQL